MSISGRKSKMTKGRLDGAVVQFTESGWTEDETKAGKDVVNFTTTFVDADGVEYKRRFFLGDQKYVHVDGDGAIQSVDESRDYNISADMATGKLFDSIEDAANVGGCPKAAKKHALSALDDIGDTPGGLDGLWVRLKSEASGSLKTDGTPFTDLMVGELLDGPDEGGGAKEKKKAATTTTAKKGAVKKAVVEDEGGEEGEGEDEDEDEDEGGEEGEGEDEDEDEDEGGEEEPDDDPVKAAAVDAMTKILDSLSTKTPLVKNFDSDAAGGGITVKQAYTASFGVLKGKDVKGPGSNLINDPQFHIANAADGLYKFIKKNGVITPND